MSQGEGDDSGPGQQLKLAGVKRFFKFIPTQQQELLFFEIVGITGGNGMGFGSQVEMGVTSAAVADDFETMNLALKLGCRADNVTSRYDGTALIAAAHLGHDGVVRALLEGGAPPDHINNLYWTALIEVIVLGKRSGTLFDPEHRPACAKLKLRPSGDGSFGVDRPLTHTD